MENVLNEEFPTENSAANPSTQTDSPISEPLAEETPVSPLEVYEDLNEPISCSSSELMAEGSINTSPAVEVEESEIVSVESEASVVETEIEAATNISAEMETSEVEGSSETEVPSDQNDHTAEAEAVESEDHQELEEVGDWSTLESEELVALAARMLAEKDIAALRNPMEAINVILTERFDTDYRSQLEVFKATGAEEAEFKADIPLRIEFRKIFQAYKNKRREFYQLMEAQLGKNLEVKKAIIEELRTLAQRQDTLGSSFQEFRTLQDRWKAAGPVPKSDSEELWKTYNFHVENFYDLVRLNRELRDLDFKHNLALKTELCRKAEELVEDEKLGEALAKLNHLHREWKEIGPVDREQREPIWQRFKEATHKMHLRREEAHRKSLEELETKLIEQEKALAELEGFSWEGISKHGEWQRATDQVVRLFEDFKKFGRPRHPKSEEFWNRALTHYRGFLHTKNQFYKEVKAGQKENLRKKHEMIARAEALMNSEDWNHAANELRRLQSDWKNIGPVSAKDAERTWTAFRTACNHFFDRLKNRYKAEEEQFEQLLRSKRDVVEKLKSSIEKPETLSLELVEQISEEFKALGGGGGKHRGVDQEFDQWTRKAYQALNIDQGELERKHFKSRVERMSSAGDVDALDREREGLRRKMDELLKDLRLLENNILFFSSGKKANPFLTQIESEIASKRETLEEIKMQLKTLAKSV